MLLSYLDDFKIVGLIFLAMLSLLLPLRPFKAGRPVGMAH